MSGNLALYGSGEFTEAIVPADKFLLSGITKPVVAIFPTAAGRETVWRNWIEKGEKHYKSLGVVVKGFPVIDKASANSEKIAEELSYYNFFVFSGGDPGYLLEVLKSSLVWKTVCKLYGSGSTVIGSSAGAMILGKKVWDSIYKFDKEGFVSPWKQGLGLVEFGILPHYDKINEYFGQEKLEKARKNFPPDIDLVGIDEDTAYIRKENRWVIKGKGSVHLNAFSET